jgi:prepilin peptidase CpaA
MHPAIQVLILAAVAIAVFTDVRRRKIYNKLTFPTMAVGLALNTVIDGPRGLLMALAGLGLGFALFFIPVVAMGRGAGDLKLLAALGALGGPMFVFWCALFTSIAGGVFALGVLLAKRQLLPVVGGMAVELYTGQLPGAYSNIRLPYALPIAAGAVAALALR